MLRFQLGEAGDIVESLVNLASVEQVCGQNQRAVSLWAAAETLRQGSPGLLWTDESENYDHELAAARAALGEEAFAVAWLRGETMTREQAVAYALGAD